MSWVTDAIWFMLGWFLGFVGCVGSVVILLVTLVLLAECAVRS